MRQTFFFLLFSLLISSHFISYFYILRQMVSKRYFQNWLFLYPFSIFHSIPIFHFPLNCSSRGHSGSPDQDSLPLVQQRLPRIHSHVPGRAHRCGTYPQLSWGWKLPSGGVFADLATLAPASWEVALETSFSRPRKKHHKDLTRQ